MTMFKLLFSGEIKKAETKSINGKPMVELSICKKNKTKEGEEDSFTWVRASVWDCPNWLAPRLVKGAFVAGCGDFSMRSYKDKDGNKATSADIRCSGYDITMPDDRPKQSAVPQTTPYEPTQRSAPVVNNQMSKPAIAQPVHVDDESVPF